MERIEAREGELIRVSSDTASLIRAAMRRLAKRLRPRLSFLDESYGDPVIRNLVGTVALDRNRVLEISPKVPGGTDWVGAVIDLLDDSRVDVTGERRSGRSRRPHLFDALAGVYAQRLTEAIRREGPLLTIHRRSAETSRLNGRLSVTEWTRGLLLRPHIFPVTHDILDADNDFTAAMAIVAIELAKRTTSTRTAYELRVAAHALRPGLPSSTVIDPSVVQRRVPGQWRNYEPAWSIAVAVLSRSSLLQRAGSLHGLEVAIEPWPLLERFLQRGLVSAAAQGRAFGRELRAEPKCSSRILTPVSRPNALECAALERIHTSRDVVPDGLLTDGGVVVATFEAKYSVPRGPNETRSHVYQAVAAAAALDSPLAVLVYPEASEPVEWAVSNFGSRPARVVAVGLDLYSYHRVESDRALGARILDLLA